MTVDIVRAETAALATLDVANDALERLGRWVEAASQATQLVAPLVGTAFVPDAYKPKIDPRSTPEQKAEARAIAIANATAAVLQGLSLGIDPLVSLQQIYIVHGRPGMYAKMMVALVQSHGHEVWTEDESDTRATVAGRRRGTENIERVTITMEQARKAGWTRNEAYGKTPRDMLWARAASRVCDRVASDVLKGIASVEQIRDELTPADNGTRTVAPPRRRAQPPQALPAAAEPPLDDDTAPAAHPYPEAETATERFAAEMKQEPPAKRAAPRRAAPRAEAPEPLLEPDDGALPIAAGSTLGRDEPAPGELP